MAAAVAAALAFSCLDCEALRESRNSVNVRSRVPLFVSLVPKISSSCFVQSVSKIARRKAGCPY